MFPVSLCSVSSSSAEESSDETESDGHNYAFSANGHNDHRTNGTVASTCATCTTTTMIDSSPDSDRISSSPATLNPLSTRRQSPPIHQYHRNRHRNRHCARKSSTPNPIIPFTSFCCSSLILIVVLATLLIPSTVSAQQTPQSTNSAPSLSINFRDSRSTEEQSSSSSSSPNSPTEQIDIKPLNSNGKSASGQTREQKGNPNYNYYVTSSKHGKESDHKPMERFAVAKFDFEHVATPYIISMWVIIVGLAKIGFHVTPKLSSVCPESVVLMILGVGIGLVMYFVGIPEERLQPLTPNLFFLFMLPPIVMDAGYHMPNRLFFDNLVSILLYAVVGTIWNAVAIGLSLYGCSKLGAFGEEIPFLDIMLFSSTVSAVDPVAVLAVFEEIHVNEVLYILVFGESLLNDAVTVVLYHMFEGYAEMAYHGGIQSIQTIDYLAGVASFFVVAIGGTLMGVFWGFMAAFVSRFTHHVKIIEPIFVFVMAYLSYLSAEMFHLSGILSLTFCGITMKNYVEENITQKSHTTLKYAMKMLANSSEAIIFVFLGVCTVNDQHKWNTPFVTLTIIFCLVYRTMGVIGLTAITNRFRLHRVNRVEQFIMAYGGLRGAVAFALILIINRQIIHAREMFVTTIIAVVYFTVFLQGMTVGALVNILNVPRANKFQLSMNERIHTRLMDHVMAGLEDISGMMMGNYKMRDKFRYYNNRYLRKWLLRDSNEMGNSSRKIFETCSRLDLQDAMNMVSKQHLVYTTLNNTVVSPNHLSVNRYLYFNNAHQPDTKGVDFCLTKPTSPPPPHREDNDANNNDKNNNGGPPSIFLTVPPVGMQAPGFEGVPYQGGTPLIDPNQSLTTLFRSYTQSNLSALNNAAMTQPIANGPLPAASTNMEKDFNYDIGNLSYSPSLKDLADAELHHILSEAMFKPFKHVTHYTRSDYSEPPPVHPPFQHQMRMQIRKLISQSEKNRRHRGDLDQLTGGGASTAGTGGNSKNKIDKRKNRQTNNIGGNHAKMMTHSGEDDEIVANSIVIANKMADLGDLKGDEHKQSKTRQNEDIEMQSRATLTVGDKNKANKDHNETETSEDDEGGIVFTAKHRDEDQLVGKSAPDSTDNDVFDVSKSTSSGVSQSANFPWRRSSSSTAERPPGSGGTSPSVPGTSANDILRRNSSRTSTSSSEHGGGSGATGHHHHHHHHHHHKKSKLKEGVIRQREFPPWIENRDYVTDYASPTSTLLDRINLLNTGPGGQHGLPGESQQSSNQVPSVYEIFHLDKSKSDSQINQTTGIGGDRGGYQQTPPASAPGNTGSSSTTPGGSSSPPKPAKRNLKADPSPVETTFPVSKATTTSTSTNSSSTQPTSRHSKEDKDDVVIQFFPDRKSTDKKSGDKDGDDGVDDDDDNSIMISKL